MKSFSQYITEESEKPSKLGHLIDAKAILPKNITQSTLGLKSPVQTF